MNIKQIYIAVKVNAHFCGSTLPLAVRTWSKFVTGTGAHLNETFCTHSVMAALIVVYTGETMKADWALFGKLSTVVGGRIELRKLPFLNLAPYCFQIDFAVRGKVCRLQKRFVYDVPLLQLSQCTRCVSHVRIVGRDFQNSSSALNLVVKPHT